MTDSPQALTRKEAKAIMVALDESIQAMIDGKKAIKKMHPNNRNDLNDLFMTLKSARIKWSKFYGIPYTGDIEVTDEEIQKAQNGEEI